MHGTPCLAPLPPPRPAHEPFASSPLPPPLFAARGLRGHLLPLSPNHYHLYRPCAAPVLFCITPASAGCPGWLPLAAPSAAARPHAPPSGRQVVSPHDGGSPRAAACPVRSVPLHLCAGRRGRGRCCAAACAACMMLPSDRLNIYAIPIAGPSGRCGHTLMSGLMRALLHSHRLRCIHRRSPTPRLSVRMCRRAICPPLPPFCRPSRLTWPALAARRSMKPGASFPALLSQLHTYPPTPTHTQTLENDCCFHSFP